MVATICLLVLVAIATATDVWRHKIYNWTTYSGIVAALVLSSLATLLSRDVLSSIGLGESVAGLLLCGLVMLVCYVFFRVGGGDVKLMAMVGAFMGPWNGIEALLWTLVLGGAMGLVVLVWRVGVWRLMRRAWQQFMWSLRIRGWPGLTEEERKQLQMPLFLAPSALLAVVIVQFSLLGHLG